jgi:hypothetical protein
VQRSPLIRPSARDICETDHPDGSAPDGVLGQDRLGNDQITPHNIVGSNRCRSMHGNQVPNAMWWEFSRETYKERPVPSGSYPKKFNPMMALIGGKENAFGIDKQIDKGRGCYRNVSLLTSWAHAPFLHNNTLGVLIRRPDCSIGYTVKEHIAMIEAALNE